MLQPRVQHGSTIAPCLQQPCADAPQAWQPFRGLSRLLHGKLACQTIAVYVAASVIDSQSCQRLAGVHDLHAKLSQSLHVLRAYHAHHGLTSFWILPCAC